MWGLSGLKLLDLSNNRLTNVVEQNFEGLYSLKELCLSSNQVRKLTIGAAFKLLTIKYTAKQILVNFIYTIHKLISLFGMY
jgi:Leucine-rich repeat (LRR) protein